MPTTFVSGRTYISGYSHQSRWVLVARTTMFATFVCLPSGDRERRSVVFDEDGIEFARVGHAGIAADRFIS